MPFSHKPKTKKVRYHRARRRLFHNVALTTRARLRYVQNPSAISAAAMSTHGTNETDESAASKDDGARVDHVIESTKFGSRAPVAPRLSTGGSIAPVLRSIPWCV